MPKCYSCHRIYLDQKHMGIYFHLDEKQVVWQVDMAYEVYPLDMAYRIILHPL